MATKSRPPAFKKKVKEAHFLIYSLESTTKPEKE
jgi:hypothetical protein